MKKRIVFFIPSLTNSAGMERAATTVANALAHRGYSVSFVCLGADTNAFFLLNKDIRVYGLGNTLGVKHSRWKTARRLLALVRELDADVLINVDVSMVQVSAIVRPLLGGVKFWNWEHFSMANVAHSLPARMQRWLAASIGRTIVLTESDKAAYPSWLRRKVEVIPNFTTINQTGERSSLQHRTAIAVGRLEEVKGFDLLIRAWAIVARDFPDWNLRIVGGGSLRQQLQNTIEDEGVSNSVKLIPSTSTIENEFSHSSLFVLSSRFEPFGLVLIEAKAFGLPIVSFDCPYGPRNIVREKVDGILVPNGDVKSLAKALGHCLSDDDLRHRFGSASLEDYKERWSENCVMNCWEKLLK